MTPCIRERINNSASAEKWKHARIIISEYSILVRKMSGQRALTCIRRGVTALYVMLGQWRKQRPFLNTQ